MTAYPDQTRMTLGRLCPTLCDSQSWLDMIQPGTVVTPLVLRCSVPDRCTTWEPQIYDSNHRMPLPWESTVNFLNCQGTKRCSFLSSSIFNSDSFGWLACQCYLTNPRVLDTKAFCKEKQWCWSWFKTMKRHWEVTREENEIFWCVRIKYNSISSNHINSWFLIIYLTLFVRLIAIS